jgi:hypothetical protein
VVMLVPLGSTYEPSRIEIVVGMPWPTLLMALETAVKSHLSLHTVTGATAGRQ